MSGISKIRLALPPETRNLIPIVFPAGAGVNRAEACMIVFGLLRYLLLGAFLLFILLLVQLIRRDFE